MQISEPAEYAILGLLEHQPMHGYEMFQQFQDGILGQVVHLEMSQMYAFLKKLERLGHIEAELEPQGTRPPRKIFHLTDQGRAVFQDWLTTPVERPREIRLLFLLKLYFAQSIMPRQVSHLVELELAACQKFLAHLEAQRLPTSSSGDTAFLERVVLHSRIHQTRALLNWLRELQEEFAEIR
ncbi:MAG TPA: helix-turn-helix transcriptional regulator [Ktedonobacteraceae bacterium]|nr:helix-turn-helix transcriptional regulator [Ktedonobacteraceae bacterium]